MDSKNLPPITTAPWVARVIEQFNGQEHVKEWCVVPQAQDYRLVGTFGLADYRKSIFAEINCADAHLCAAAPELRAALHAALVQLQALEAQGHLSLGDTILKAESALAKALSVPDAAGPVS
jgi:hypothetical protein